MKDIFISFSRMACPLIAEFTFFILYRPNKTFVLSLFFLRTIIIEISERAHDSISKFERVHHGRGRWSSIKQQSKSIRQSDGIDVDTKNYC
jgi:hypothetical protein